MSDDPDRKKFFPANFFPARISTQGIAKNDRKARKSRL